VAVGTTKKSAAAICWILFVRNMRHVCDGGLIRGSMYFARESASAPTPALSVAATPVPSVV
jgi:hypothetical protein